MGDKVHCFNFSEVKVKLLKIFHLEQLGHRLNIFTKFGNPTEVILA